MYLARVKLDLPMATRRAVLIERLIKAGLQVVHALVMLLCTATISLAEESLTRSFGGLIYVPTFSHVHVSSNDQQPLAVTLVVHNIDASHEITLSKVDFFNSDGDLIRRFLDEAVTLKRFQSQNFAISIQENSGGVGANFVVEWTSKSSTLEPAANAIMVGGTGTQGLSFQTTGHVIARKMKPAD